MKYLAAAWLACALPLVSQTPAPAKFDVASIKPSQAGPGSNSGITTRHGSIFGQNVTLKRCIIGAYNVGPHQIAGGPPWIDSDRFEIRAQVDQDINDDAALMVMLQDLLAGRFKLVLHKESRPMRAFVLEVAKNGPKLEKADPGEAATQSSNGPAGSTIDARRTSMEAFARILARQTELPVINRTGLDGIYNIKLQWTPDRLKSTAASGSEYPSLVTAIQEQLGLHLRSEKTLVETLVVDSAEKPSAN